MANPLGINGPGAALPAGPVSKPAQPGVSTTPEGQSFKDLLLDKRNMSRMKIYRIVFLVHYRNFLNRAVFQTF